MDRDWMRQQLEAFDKLASRYHRSKKQSFGYMGDQTLYDELHRAEPTIKQILGRLDPQIANAIDLDQMAGIEMARNEVQRGLGMLDDIDEWATRLAPDAPSLPADRFHPWVWDAAHTF